MKSKNIIFAVVTLIVSMTGAACAAEYGRGNRAPDYMLLDSNHVTAAEITKEEQLIGGPKAEGRPGDFVIWNNRVGFVIAGARPASGMVPMGGVIEDAGLLRAGDDGMKYWWNLMGDSPLLLYKGGDPLFGSRLFAPSSAVVFKDGSDGEAVVRVFGRDAEFDMRKEITGVPASPLKVKIMVDYILRPDSNVLETKVTIINTQKKKQTIGIGQLFVMGDGAPMFLPGHGFDLGGVEGLKLPFLAAEGRVVSYAWFTPGEDINVHSKLGKPIVVKLGSVKVPADDMVSFSQYLVVGDGDVNSVYENISAQGGAEVNGVIKGKLIIEDGGKFSSDTAVTVSNENGEPLNRAIAGSDGTFSFRMPPGKYIVGAEAGDREAPGAMSIEPAAGETVEIEIPLGAPATLSYDISDDSGENIPATISFRRKGEKGFQENHFTVTGLGEVSVKPGEYEVYFSRGMEYEYELLELNLAAGGRTAAKAVLRHVVDTAGYLSGDFHIHAQPSFDTNDTLEEKVTAIAASGLDVAISTDHNRRTDYAPTIRRLGLERKLKSIIGNEVTTMRLGHFNVFPVKYKPLAPNEGAVDVVFRTMPDIFSEVVNDADWKTLIQLNHPRALGGGYLGFVGYQAETGAWKDNDNFYMGFDAIEVLNFNRYDDMEKVMADWFSFTNRGKKVAGTGNSDSHRVFELSVGYPRNYVRSSSAVPGDVVESEFIDSVAGQHLTVCGGPFVKMNANDAGEMGDLVTDTDGEVDLNVEALAPSWVEFDTVILIANGEELLRVKATGSETPVRYKNTFKVKPERDTWYIVRVEGSGDLFPVYPGEKPISFTNPVYVDVDGNGRFDPPYEFESE